MCMSFPAIVVYWFCFPWLSCLVCVKIVFMVVLCSNRQDPQENDSNQPGGQSDADISEEAETFWGLDDVPGKIL